MPERTTPDTTTLMAQLSYWSAYTEGVADTTNESYDHVLKNLSSTYKDAVNAIRNDFGEDLDRVASQFEMMMPAMEEFRGYDEGEQETRIVQAFDILKSDVEKHITARQRSSLTLDVEARELWGISHEHSHLSEEGFETVIFTQGRDDSMVMRFSGNKNGEVRFIANVSGNIINADGESLEGLTVTLAESDFHGLAADMDTDLNNCAADYGVVRLQPSKDGELWSVEYLGPSVSDDRLFQIAPDHLVFTVTDQMRESYRLSDDYTINGNTIVTKDTLEVTADIPELNQGFSVKITKTVQNGAVRYEPFVANNLPQDEDLAAAVKDVSDALSGVAERYCKQATACGLDQDFTKIRSAEIKQANPNVFTPPSSLPAKIELDAVDIWLASCQLHLTAACYNHFVLRQEGDDTVHISGVLDGKIESVRTVCGRILNADGEPYRGTVPIFADDFHSLAAKMHTDVSNSDYAWGTINVNIVSPEHLSDVHYEGVCFHDDEAIFQDLPQHLERTAIDFMNHHPDTEGYPLKSETIVTDDSMEVSLAFAQLGQNFDIKITKTIDDGAVRYEPFVTNNLPRAEFLAAPVKEVWNALSSVAEHYCQQATARGFDQDFTKIGGAEIKQEKPNVFTPPSSLSPAAPSGSGIKRPSGLKAPGERKPSVGGRSL